MKNNGVFMEYFDQLRFFLQKYWFH